jgi:hypothetical protein
MKNSKEQVQKMWQETQENAKKLNECQGPHDFKPIEGRKYRCTHCTGEISTIHYYWYYQGIRHSKKQQSPPKCNDPICNNGVLQMEGETLGHCRICRPEKW